MLLQYDSIPMKDYVLGTPHSKPTEPAIGKIIGDATLSGQRPPGASGQGAVGKIGCDSKGDLNRGDWSERFGSYKSLSLECIDVCFGTKSLAEATFTNMILTQLQSLTEDALYSLLRQPLKWLAGLLGLYLLHTVGFRTV